MRRRGAARCSTTACAATSSGGETMAPRAIAIGRVMPGTMAIATAATANVLATTSPTASDAMLPRFARKLRIGVKNAATYTIGGSTSTRMASGATSTRGTPGMVPSARPPTRRRTGYGVRKYRASVTSAATAIRTARRSSAVLTVPMGSRCRHGCRSCVRDHRDLRHGQLAHGEAQRDPLSQAALERMHARDSPTLQLKRHTGARRFVGSGAVDDEILIVRDLGRKLVERIGRDPACARDHVGSGDHVERGSEVEDQDVVAGVELCLEVLRGDARDPEAPQKKPAPDVLEHDVRDQRERDHRAKRATQ